MDYVALFTPSRFFLKGNRTHQQPINTSISLKTQIIVQQCREVLKFSITSILLCVLSISSAESGYRLWLRYDLISDRVILTEYQKQIRNVFFEGSSSTISVARNELLIGLKGLLGKQITTTTDFGYSDGLVVCGTLGSSAIKKLNIQSTTLGDEGYIIRTISANGKRLLVVVGKKDIGVLYGVFHVLRLLQTNHSLNNLSIESSPKVMLRLLNHWDNLDRSVERGYAGLSLWDWHKLPTYIDQRYIDYARANASIGINGTVLTNVNANATLLTPDYLKKVAALADVFRPYGIKVYLTARFNAPMELDGFSTADPLDASVRNWWRDKVKEIYKYVPDFGGFVVKANSEGQPGPQNYKRNHADGANMLAEALAPFNGIVMWRSFVYNNEVPEDRAKQAYNEFKPLDGDFKSNVMVQVKNGAIDFQPREPFHPIFGAMPKTPLMIEFQITQEYLGFSSHLVYLAPLFKECLQAETGSNSLGSTVASVVDGTLENHLISGMAGVSNIGNDLNWCGHPFAQANWYAFGRLAWNHSLSSDAIADDWIRMTFSNSREAITPIKSIMLASREVAVNYMTPMGLHHIMGYNHHYGPGPWIKDGNRADWTSVYYHKADSLGIGFNRTQTGSNAVSQYFPSIQTQFESTELCPEKYLLWFHHLSWDYKTKSGQSLWDALCYKYYSGVDSVVWMQKEWKKIKGKIDEDRFNQVNMLLKIQFEDAQIWRDACVLYFQTFSRKRIPIDLEKPLNSLDYYMKIAYPFAPGIKPQWR